MDEYVVGIDIGSSKVCASAGLMQSNGKIQIVGINSVKSKGIKRGVVVDIDNAAESIKHCLDGLEKMLDFKINSAYISITSGICELINNKGIVSISSESREITKKDVDRAIEAAKLISIDSDKEIIGVIPGEYAVDGYDHVKEPIGMSCNNMLQIDAQVILSNSSIVNNIMKSVNRIGVKVEGIVLQPVAISTVALKTEETHKGVALVDIGYETTNVSIFKNERLLYTSSIPIGGNNITNDIALCLKISYEEAEKLKFKYGSLVKDNNLNSIKISNSYDNLINVDHDMLVDIITARVDEILMFINNNIKDSGHYDGIDDIVIVGGGVALLKGITYFSENITNKRVKIGQPEYIGAASPLYAGAVGIVKDVFDFIKVSHVDEYEECEEQKDYKEKKDGIISKIKEFFEDLF